MCCKHLHSKFLAHGTIWKNDFTFVQFQGESLLTHWLLLATYTASHKCLLNAV